MPENANTRKSDEDENLKFLGVSTKKHHWVQSAIKTRYMK